MGNDRRHKIEDGVWRRNPLQRSLRERGIASALSERTGLEELVSGDLTPEGLAFSLARFLGLRLRGLGRILLGDFYLGPYEKESLAEERRERIGRTNWGLRGKGVHSEDFGELG